mgnify:FL=1
MTKDQPTVLLGIGAGIAAYKAADLTTALLATGVEVRAVMTPRATSFVSPLVMEALTGWPCPVEVIPSGSGRAMEHIDLARAADLVLVAPASADLIARLAQGLADDLLTTTVLASTAPVLVAPAMNTQMLAHPAVQANLDRLVSFGYELIPPAEGRLACGEVGPGRLPEAAVLVSRVRARLGLDEASTPDGDLAGLRVLVTAGATIERIDPVRYITNHSTGRMGFALAQAAYQRGAEVTMIAGATADPPPQIGETIRVESAEELFQAVSRRAAAADVIIMAAAVADYRPRQVAAQKIKKSDGLAVLELERTRDILAWLGTHRLPGQTLCGFSMETTDLIAHSRRKLVAKGIDLIVANDLFTPGAGFGVDTNVVTIITPHTQTSLPIASKREVADQVLTAILQLRSAS